MVSLLSGLPPEELRIIIEKKLKPGCVLKLEVKFPNITKPKFLVLVSLEEPDCFLFVINSNINPFILNRNHLHVCQVKIEANDHDFLTHDSNIACHETLKINREEVISSLMVDPGGFQGEISFSVKQKIINAVKIAKTIDSKDKKSILCSLNSA